MTIDWLALVTVLAIALGSVVVLSSLFAFGVRGLSEREVARAAGGAGTAAFAGAIACFTVCAAIVAYGLYLIIA